MDVVKSKTGFIWFYRPSMSQGTVMIQTQNRLHEKDFTIATPEEFVHRFGGTRVINKVRILFTKLVISFLSELLFIALKKFPPFPNRF